MIARPLECIVGRPDDFHRFGRPEHRQFGGWPTDPRCAQALATPERSGDAEAEEGQRGPGLARAASRPILRVTFEKRILDVGGG